MNSDLPKISVAIATYNGGRFLREQLDSLYQQTLLPYEVVVCDDCSSDTTPAILEEYHQRYGLQYVINPTPLGCNRNFIKAFGLCQGDYVCICDQDDIWLPNKIQTLYGKISSMDANKPLVVSSLRYDIDAQGNKIGEVKLPDSEGWKATMLTYARSQGCTMIMNRKLLHIVLEKAAQYPEQVYKMYYDELVAYAAVVTGEKYNLKDQLMLYRHHDKNVVGRYYDSLSFRDKVQQLPTFYGFMIDERLVPYCVTRQIFDQELGDSELRDFLCHMETMMAQPTVWGKLRKLLLTPQLAMRQKIKILFLSPLSIILKHLYHFPTI